MKLYREGPGKEAVKCHRGDSEKEEVILYRDGPWKVGV